MRFLLLCSVSIEGSCVYLGYSKAYKMISRCKNKITLDKSPDLHESQLCYSTMNDKVVRVTQYE